MRCEQVRAALSARLDAEAPAANDSAVETHLAACADCRAWLADAQRLNRLLQESATAPAPDRTEAILEAIGADAALGRGADVVPGRQRVLRLAVAGVAVVQLLTALETLLAALGIGPSTHLDHELAAFDATVAAAFLLAAWRPAMAWAYAPLAASLGVLLGATSVLDIGRGATTIGHETGHLLVIIQAMLLWQLARSLRRTGSPRTA
jgi:predicted anti-sigma-YlaC factor YlaD